MSAQANHDHSVHVRELPQLCSPMSDDTTAITAIPRALESYPSGADQTLAADLAMRVQIEPFNLIARGAIDLLLNEKPVPDGQPPIVVTTPTLIPRRSTAAPRKR